MELHCVGNVHISFSLSAMWTLLKVNSWSWHWLSQSLSREEEEEEEGGRRRIMLQQ